MNIRMVYLNYVFVKGTIIQHKRVGHMSEKACVLHTRSPYRNIYDDNG